MNSPFDWLLILGIFLFFFILFQLWAIRTWKHRMTWICADYIWLLFAVAGIFGAANEWSRTQATEKIEAEQRLFTYRTYDRASDISPYTRPIFLKEKGHVDKAAELSEWASWAIAMLGSSEDAIGIFLEKSEKLLIDGSLPLEIYEPIVNKLREQREDYAHMSLLKEGLKFSHARHISMALTPLLLSIAVSLRLGKTTADYCRARNGAGG